MAIAQILSSGGVASGGTLYVPATTQLLAFFGYLDGSESTWSWLTIDGSNGSVLATSSYNGGTTGGKCASSCGIYLAPPRSSTVTFASSTGMTTAWFAIVGINPVDPVIDAGCASLATSERYIDMGVTVTGTQTYSLVLGQHYGAGEFAEDRTVDAHTNTTNYGLYANMPSDGSFFTGYTTMGSADGMHMGVGAISFNLKPASRRMGLLLD